MVGKKWKPEYAQRAAELALLGATDKILAAVFGVAEDTIRVWKGKHPEFQTELLAAKTAANLNVAKSLYEQAIGYDYETQDSRVVKDKDGNEHLAVVTRTVRVPGKATPAIFWLKNREPELWRDVQQVEHSGLEGLLDEIKNQSRGLPSAHPTAQNHPELRSPTQH